LPAELADLAPYRITSVLLPVLCFDLRRHVLPDGAGHGERYAGFSGQPGKHLRFSNHGLTPFPPAGNKPITFNTVRDVLKGSNAIPTGIVAMHNATIASIL
jgi:hypothetical protein